MGGGGGIPALGDSVADPNDSLSREMTLDRQVVIHRERKGGSRIECVDRHGFYFCEIKRSARRGRNKWEFVRYRAIAGDARPRLSERGNSPLNVATPRPFLTN